MQMLFNKEVKIVEPFRLQLLKWIGNKQKYASQIVSYFPTSFKTYFEPFLGSGAVLATLQPEKAVASDIFQPLMGIWTTLHDSPHEVKKWYRQRRSRLNDDNKVEIYEQVKASYNANPNPADLLFISRACYGGVIRFRKADGYISTPCGVHTPISPDSFDHRVDIWRQRIQGTRFLCTSFQEAMKKAKPMDLVYCDPPYADSQAILYGAQSFNLEELFHIISECKKRGVYVALSIDGKKYSGKKVCRLPIPEELFEREVFLEGGASMLKRFQMEGNSCHEHCVADRLLLTY